MKQLFDFLPLLVFFAFYKFQGIFWATGALLVVSTLQLSYMWLRYRRVEKSMLFTFLLVLVFGGLTIWLQSEAFIKWKVTLVNGLFSAALAISQLIKKPLIRQLLGKEIDLPDTAWRNINLGWALFFFACGLANIYVAFWLPTEVWVNFKVFGLTALTLVASVATGAYLYRLLPDAQPAGEASAQTVDTAEALEAAKVSEEGHQG